MTDHFIHCADAATYLQTVPSESVDLVVTDPPYLCRYKDRSGRTIANDDNAEAVLSVFDETYRVMKQDSYCISFYGWTGVAAFTHHWEKLGFRIVGQFVSPKKYTSKSGFAQYCHEAAFLLVKGRPALPKQPIKDVQAWHYTGNKAHPTEKSPSILAPLIKSYSKPGDTVLDSFSGSGSTCVAAALTGRKAVGIELEPRYCAIAERRLAGVARMFGEAA